MESKKFYYREAKSLGYKGPLKWVGSTTEQWKAAYIEAFEADFYGGDDGPDNRPHWKKQGPGYKKATGKWKRPEKPKNELEFGQPEPTYGAPMWPDNKCACRGKRTEYLSYIKHSETECVGLMAYTGFLKATNRYPNGHGHFIIERDYVCNIPWNERTYREDEEDDEEIDETIAFEVTTCKRCGVKEQNIHRAVKKWHGEKKDVLAIIEWVDSAKSEKNGFYFPHVYNIHYAWKKMMQKKRERYTNILAQKFDGLITEMITEYL
jgi:hypothetical protein